MNFSRDRDLLQLEPTLFGDVTFAAQQRVNVDDGVLSGTTLSSASADFVAAGLDAGSVVMIDGVAHVVTGVTDAQTLTVSRTATPDGTSLAVVVRTFAPQAALVHDVLLRLLGMDADDPGAALTEDAIVSLSVMARLEALGTLEQVYSGAVAVMAEGATLLHKAKEYRLRFGRALRSARVLIDTDGDGLADVRRPLGVVRMTRA